MFGITCFEIARVCFLLSSMFIFLWAVAAFTMSGTGWLTNSMSKSSLLLNAAIFMMRALVVMMIVAANYRGVSLCKHLMREYNTLNSNAGLMNKRRIIAESDRIMSIKLMVWYLLIFIPAMLLFDKSGFLPLLSIFVRVAAEYLVCCTPLPPQKSKVKKWIESLLTARKLSPAFDSV
ncbi:MAG: hypothetical protein WC823_03245 [Parcubacteria group bacterium]